MNAYNPNARENNDILIPENRENSHINTLPTGEVQHRINRILENPEENLSDTLDVPKKTQYVPIKDYFKNSARLASQKNSDFSEATPAQKVGGAIVGGGVGAGAAWGLGKGLVALGKGSFVSSTLGLGEGVAATLHSAGAFLFSTPVIIGAGVLGMIWGARKLWKLWKRR